MLGEPLTDDEAAALCLAPPQIGAQGLGEALGLLVRLCFLATHNVPSIAAESGAGQALWAVETLFLTTNHSACSPRAEWPSFGGRMV